ncbi:MAG: 3-hydroxyacyl-CoA dehydrogenase NAD-binding domain-containing protein [Rhodospirillaceae bacterium]|nr:3-hydroxyacyl-CoA dehydrogenase NAD-binding domain-containing protein [Rhodospirillaceae bacterium]
MAEIKKAAVIGAGVMGAGIAAHLTNAGVPVVLLDIVPKDATNRNVIAETAIKKLEKSDPAAFMSKRNARLITPGNTEDHLDLLKDCDWIVEAVIERLDIKQALYKRIDQHRKKGSIVSSNTSTIPLKELVGGLPDAFAADFMITHFFNPPRYMRLLEIVASEKTRKDAVETIRAFGDVGLGKGVIVCKDTPGFVANRIGTYWMQCGVTEAIKLGLTVEEADAIGGRPFGIPKTGFFGLMDLVGIDLMPHVANSMQSRLAKDDDYQRIHGEPPVITKMLKNGWIGRKGPSGFYRLTKKDGERLKESIDLKTAEYRPSAKASLESMDASKKGGLKALVEHPDKGGQFAWAMARQALTYTASLVPEIADTIVDVDEAMKDGYAWSMGPFEMIDSMGAAWFAAKLTAAKIAVPPLLKLAADKGGFYRVEGGKLQFLTTQGGYADVPRPAGVLKLSDIKRAAKPVLKNPSAKVWDIGDGVLCFEFTSKMNALDPLIMALYKDAIKLIKGNAGYKALVIHNEGPNFSVGANLGLLLFAANIAVWGEIESQIEDGQKTYMALKQAPFPVVAAPLGMALGGGCEILLHADAIQAHAETYTGLVEVGVGVIPGWGGCKEMLLRLKADKKMPGGPMPAVAKAFEYIGTAQVAKSAFEAREMGILRKSDGITMNRDRVLADAKAKALQLAKDYQPPKDQIIALPGPTGVSALKLALSTFVNQGKATPHDQVVSLALAKVLTGGKTDHTETVTEKDLLKLERQAFMELAKTTGTLARMEHMLATGKPLRN